MFVFVLVKVEGSGSLEELENWKKMQNFEQLKKTIFITGFYTPIICSNWHFNFSNVLDRTLNKKFKNYSDLSFHYCLI